MKLDCVQIIYKEMFLLPFYRIGQAQAKKLRRNIYRIYEQSHIYISIAQ